MSAAQQLRRVKTIFESHGVTSEVGIARHVAFLLLVHDAWETIQDETTTTTIEDLLNEHIRALKELASSLHIPPPPDVQRIGTQGLHAILDELEYALRQSTFGDDRGSFFQRELRFELLKGSAGSQYPTPHHIGQFMAALAVTELSGTVLDPTAGSAGLLMPALSLAPNASLMACDFDLSWAELGSANLILHEHQDAEYYLQSATRLAAMYTDHFDCVLMNPPFSGSRSRTEVEEAVGAEYGTSNPTVLSALALKLLKPGRRAAFLVPSGVLFGGGGQAHLREELLNHDLEGIITLENDLFQPYSNVIAHLVVVRKREEEETPSGPIWLCNVMRDGYPPGAGRDLTESPQAQNDELPRTRELLLSARDTTWPINLPLAEGGVVEAIQLRAEDSIPGAAVRQRGDGTDPDWKISQLASGALVRVTESTRLLGLLYVPYTEEEGLAVSADDLTQVEWSSLWPDQDWSDTLPDQWQVMPVGEGDEESDVTVRITADEARAIEMTQKRTTLSFSPESEQPILACMIDLDGVPITPWCHLTDEEQVEAITSSDFGGAFGAIAIQDGREALCGWVLSLSSVETESEDDSEIDEDPSTAWLLIVTNPDADFLRVNDEDVVALLGNGWICITTEATAGIRVGPGEPVALRDNISIRGFALGPAPADLTAEEHVGIFGVWVPREELQRDGRPVSFEPKNFLPELPAPPAAHSSEVLASIRKNQAKFDARVDSLLQMLAGSPGTRDAEVTRGHKPFIDLLDHHQAVVWDLLQQHAVDNGNSVPFTIAHLARWFQEALTDEDIATTSLGGEDYLQQQLDLFLRLGLVVRVNVTAEGELVNAYCLTTNADVVKQPESFP